jgi:hypothetical protein
VKDGTVNSNNHMVSRVTSDVFKTTWSRQLEL